MHTLEALQNGELQGVTRLQLAENLNHFPSAIYDLADSLEILDLSNNQLASLPDDLDRLKNLRILFCSNNQFTHLPKVLGKCPKLEMIGFKANQIRKVSSDSIPEQTRWLILTDNQINELPSDIGKCRRLQKLALAGNRLVSLPASLANCHNLELIRLSANQLATFPEVVLKLPKLAWFAFSGNPFCAPRDQHDDFVKVKRSDLQLQQVLGQGASGVISQASWVNNSLNFPEQVAVKVFKGELTSDGFPEDELDACLATGSHPNLVTPLAKIGQEEGAALVMELIPPHYINLGQPPSLASCTRDTFTQGQRFSVEQVHDIIEQMEGLVAHFAERAVSHGDLYAHNVLIDPETCHILFGDFGAASKYAHLKSDLQEGIKAIEQRALSYFVEDMISICDIKNGNDQELLTQLQARYS
ncbi:leucine-rich repeat domain-containing protein [Marinomonas epiphytica]